jgi:hypothetical protein
MKYMERLNAWRNAYNKKKEMKLFLLTHYSCTFVTYYITSNSKAYGTHRFNPNSQGRFNDTYPEWNQPNSSYW